MPEIWTGKLYDKAMLLDGEDRLRAAEMQKHLSVYTLVDMLLILYECYENLGDAKQARVHLRIAKDVIDAFSEDTRTPYADETVFEQEARVHSEKIECLLAAT